MDGGHKSHIVILLSLSRRVCSSCRVDEAKMGSTRGGLFNAPFIFRFLGFLLF